MQRVVGAVVFVGLCTGSVIVVLYNGWEFANKGLFDWLEILFVPLAIGVGVPWFTNAQRAQRERDREQRAHVLEIESQRAQDDALGTYLDKMSELLIDGQLRNEVDSYADRRITARARTLAVLRRLDGGRKRTILLFLREARLINRADHPRDGREVNPPIVGLRDADLTNANLRRAKLINTDRDEPISLEGANLEGADLQGADLEGADLRATNLNGANLSGVNLSGANLSYAQGITNEELEQKAAFLKGATMPNGQKYEDWLKSKGRREDEENSGSS